MTSDKGREGAVRRGSASRAGALVAEHTPDNVCPCSVVSVVFETKTDRGSFLPATV